MPMCSIMRRVRAVLCDMYMARNKSLELCTFLLAFSTDLVPVRLNFGVFSLMYRHCIQAEILW